MRDVFTEQNRHPRVQVSPISLVQNDECAHSDGIIEHTIIVAVAPLRPSASVAPSFPPQQSPILGHRASSQTV